VRAIAGGAERGPVVAATIAAGSLLLLVLTVAAGLPTAEVAMVLTCVAVLALGYRTLLRWQAQLVFLLLVILFVPIKRYELPGNLPFDMEPYRAVVILLMAGWLASLLVDPRVRLRRSGLEGPLALVALASLASVFVNGSRVDELMVGGEVVKALMFLASFLLVLYLIVSVVRSLDHVRLLVQVLVAGGAVVATFGVIEAQTAFNVFDKLGSVIPLLNLKEAIGEVTTRSGRLRVFASGQGPIALGAALAMLVPLGVALARTAPRPARWWVAVVLIVLGALATRSRTSVVMLLTIALVFLWLQPAATRRGLAILLIPALVAVQLVLPGTIGSLKGSFFPEGGLIAQQSANPGWRGSGRLADVGPTIDEWVAKPLLGQGYGTRVTGRSPRANTLILDNQWLKTLVETGALGALAYIWLFCRFGRVVGRRAKGDSGEEGWLLTAFAASVLAFSVGMFFYDAFAFIQVTFLLYIMLGLGSVLLQRAPATTQVTAARRPTPPGRAAPTYRGWIAPTA
jgi:polysaccharide biosynthesis protein PslJ